MNNKINYYELLGVNKNATKEEIKNAYKMQMKKWHPDINKSSDAQNMSIKINEAKEVLLDDEKRKDYDDYLEKEINEAYNKYTQTKNYYQAQTNASKEENYVTKWEYFWQWIKYSNNTFFRKMVGFIGVMLESLLCSIIHFFIILIAYIANFGSYIINFFLKILGSVCAILLVLLVIQIITSGFEETIKNIDKGFLTLVISTAGLSILSFILSVLPKIILSPKVFNYLYNEINIKLFKKCVGYKY